MAAVSCFAESLQLNLIREGSAVRASVFYPSGGLMNTGLYTAARNRPEHLQRRGAGTGRTSMTFDQLRAKVWEATGREPPVADLDELGDLAVDGACERRFIVAHAWGTPLSSCAGVRTRSDGVNSRLRTVSACEGEPVGGVGDTFVMHMDREALTTCPSASTT